FAAIPSRSRYTPAVTTPRPCPRTESGRAVSDTVTKKGGNALFFPLEIALGAFPVSFRKKIAISQSTPINGGMLKKTSSEDSL
ncbi:MAG TPA: hypothetical protein VIN33_02040, partial [Marinobacter sp.]